MLNIPKATPPWGGAAMRSADKTPRALINPTPDWESQKCTENGTVLNVFVRTLCTYEKLLNSSCGNLKINHVTFSLLCN